MKMNHQLNSSRLASLGGTAPAMPNATMTFTDSSFNRFRAQARDENLDTDELRFGIAYADLAPVPEPAAALPGALLLLTAALVERRRKRSHAGWGRSEWPWRAGFAMIRRSIVIDSLSGSLRGWPRVSTPDPQLPPRMKLDLHYLPAVAVPIPVAGPARADRNVPVNNPPGLKPLNR